jgi:hypothetical protein
MVISKENRRGNDMNNREKRHIALHAPNLMNICVDRYESGNPSGRLYHRYAEKPGTYIDLIRLIEATENLFDSISFPQASTQTRTFIKKEGRKEDMPEKVIDSQDVIAHRGELATFLVHVRYRQNSSWQGEVEWVEGETVREFASELELFKIMNNILARTRTE